MNSGVTEKMGTQIFTRMSPRRKMKDTCFTDSNDGYYSD